MKSRQGAVRSQSAPLSRSIVLWLCIGFAVLTAIVPCARSCYRLEITYNEGWNVCTTQLFARHALLYPVPYAWTSVNYPMLSFVIMEQLHRLTHEYLFTARFVSLISLIASCVLVGVIIRRLGGSLRAAVLGGFFSLALFACAATSYVGMDDPQLLAEVFFLAGLLTYIVWRQSLPGLALTALLFAIGANIKHSPIDFPLAVMIDLLLTSYLGALWFTLCGAAFAAISLALNLHFGGPAFITLMLAPRSYSYSYAFHSVMNTVKPLAPLFCLALYMAFHVRNDRNLRIAAILMVTGLAVGGYFSGGLGVAVNGLFTMLFAMAILTGLFCAAVEDGEWRWARSPRAALTPVLLFAFLTIPWVRSGYADTLSSLRALSFRQRQFDEEVAFIRAQPGPALCESLLRCYAAGKPYVYDHFNATRLIQFGKLDANVIIQQIDEQRYGAIELMQPIEYDIEHPLPIPRVDPGILLAAAAHYRLVMQHEKAYLYVPK